MTKLGSGIMPEGEPRPSIRQQTKTTQGASINALN
jgi:hypothetical protein